MIDIAKLRALLAAADPLPPSWDLNALRLLMRHGSSSVHGRRAYPDERLDRDAALIVAVVNALPALLDELEALRAERDRLRAEPYANTCRDLNDRLNAWENATGCDTPEEAAEVRRRWEAEDAEQDERRAREGK